MERKAYVVTDLGSGDGGKGGIVHALVYKTGAHTIIKRGGGQGSHGVRTSKGESFDFSHWGCGTFEGVPTYLSQQMIILPDGLLNEAAALRYTAGITDPFGMLTVDGRALCATPFHGILSRVRELARGSNSRGTVGTGAGEAYREYRAGGLSMKASDLRSANLGSLLAGIRASIIRRIADLDTSGIRREDHDAFRREVALLGDDGFLDHLKNRFAEAGRLVQVVGNDYLSDVILSRPGNVIVETSHGVLTDRESGFRPHVSAIRTVPGITRRLLDAAAYDGTVVNIGVMRAYAVRHGAGPLLTYDPVMTEMILPHRAADTNRYQGEVRAGPLDMVLVRHALDACGTGTFDGLAVTCADQIRDYGSWPICDRYDDGAPVIRSIPFDGLERNACNAIMAETVGALGVPLRLVSWGQVETDKSYL